MSYTDKDPAGAKQLLDGQEGWVYLDVRSEQEFGQGHVPGAYNVPLAHAGPSGMEPNPQFLEVVQRHFQPDAQLLVGCAAGGRSARACDSLGAAGYTNLINVLGGFSGMRDGTGQVVQPGWQACGLPTETEAVAGRDYASLR